MDRDVRKGGTPASLQMRSLSKQSWVSAVVDRGIDHCTSLYSPSEGAAFSASAIISLRGLDAPPSIGWPSTLNSSVARTHFTEQVDSSRQGRVREPSERPILLGRK